MGRPEGAAAVPRPPPRCGVAINVSRARVPRPPTNSKRMQHAVDSVALSTCTYHYYRKEAMRVDVHRRQR